MKRARSIGSVTGIIAALVLSIGVAFAQPASSESEHQAHHPTTQSQVTGGQSAAGQGMGMMGRPGMLGGQGMMGGPQMMAMPMMPCCPCTMMGMGMMMGGARDSATAAKMMQMHAEMMKANAAIMEKYAKIMNTGK